LKAAKFIMIKSRKRNQ